MDHLFHKNLLQEKHNLEWQLAQANLKIKNLEEQLHKLTKQTMISEEVGGPGTANPNVPPPPNPFQQKPPFTRPLPDNTKPVPMPRMPGRFNFPSDFIKQIEGLPAEFWERIRPGRRPRTVQEGYEIILEYVNQNGIDGLEQYLNESAGSLWRWIRDLFRKRYDPYPARFPGSPARQADDFNKEFFPYLPGVGPHSAPRGTPATRPAGEPIRIRPERPFGERPPQLTPRPPSVRPSGSPRPGIAPGGVSSDQPDEFYDFPGLPQ